MTDADIQPSIEFAQDWLTGHLNMIKDGGSWMVPRSMTVYTVQHSTKTLVRSIGYGDPTTEHVAQSIGWTVKGPEEIQTRKE